MLTFELSRALARIRTLSVRIGDALAPLALLRARIAAVCSAPTEPGSAYWNTLPSTIANVTEITPLNRVHRLGLHRLASATRTTAPVANSAFVRRATSAIRAMSRSAIGRRLTSCTQAFLAIGIIRRCATGGAFPICIPARGLALPGTAGHAARAGLACIVRTVVDALCLCCLRCADGNSFSTRPELALVTRFILHARRNTLAATANVVAGTIGATVIGARVLAVRRARRAGTRRLALLTRTLVG